MGHRAQICPSCQSKTWPPIGAKNLHFCGRKYSTARRAKARTRAPPTRLSLAGGTSSLHNEFLELEWRPALHDLGSNSLGYSPELEIQFFKPTLRYFLKPKKFAFQEFNLLRIMAANKSYPLLNRQAWLLDLGFNRALGQNRPRQFLEVGIGQATRFATNNGRAFLLALGSVGNEKQLGGHVSFGSLLGFTQPISSTFQFSGQGRLARNFGLKQTQNDWQTATQIVYTPHHQLEIKVALQKTSVQHQATLGFGTYF